jgi:hypothetical protein
VINNVNDMGSHRVHTFSIPRLCSSLADDGPLRQKYVAYYLIYSGTSMYRFSKGWRKQTMNAGKRLIRETVTHCK